jgi:NADH:ubiquinone oxidoreductase subunit B-like Fe-S oxidoreductase
MELAIDGLSAILWGGCTPTINAMIQLLMELTDIAETESKKPKSAPQKVAASAKK